MHHTYHLSMFVSNHCIQFYNFILFMMQKKLQLNEIRQSVTSTAVKLLSQTHVAEIN